jgi:PAS domain S-box-containing protein
MTNKILVVDNHPVILKFMTSLLQNEGHRVVTAEDGLSALDVLKDFVPHVIFVDLIMPNIGGEKLCRIIRGMPELKETYVAILSGIAADEEMDFARFGANTCIAKGPFRQMARHVLAAVSEASSGSNGRSKGRPLGSETLQPRQVARELLAVKKHFEIVLDSMAEGILEVTRETRIVYANPAALSLIGVPEPELLTTRLADLFEGDDRPRLQSSLETTAPASRHDLDDKAFILRGRQVSVKILPIKDEANKTIVMLTNVTEQKRIQKQIQHAGKIEAIGTLAGGIAHAFNNALTVIIGNIALAKKYADRDSKVLKKLEEAEIASLKARDLTQRLMPFSDDSTPLRHVASIEETVRSACGSALAGTGSRCEVSIPEELWWVKGNPDQIRQALHNVVINAVEATVSDGTVRVAAENHVSTKADELHLQPGQYVRISVQDRGAGISEECLPKVYDPYYTTKEMGRGLGLATAYSFISKHDGLITASSEPSSGTTFSIYLPAVPPPACPTGEPDPTARGAKGKVLVMDDDETVCEILGEALITLGYESRFASDGREAIGLYTLAKESGEPFDAVIMDLTISKGMGGMEAIQKLLKIDPRAKAIVSSGYADDPAMLDYARYGFRGGLDKPFRVKDLKAMLERLIAEE